MSTTTDRKDAIETACHNAIHAMHREAARAHREQRSPEACLILAAALEQLLADDGIETIEHISECWLHLRRQAAPRRGGS
jgi:hypothetical protein